MKDAIKKITAPLLIVLAPMAMLYPLWSNPISAGEDDVVYYYPLRSMVGESLARGQWPISDKLSAGGSAVLADPQSAVFFPATWLFAVMPAKLAYSLSIFAAFAVAGLGTWVYLRRLGLVRPAAFFGAIAFMFCGFFIGHRVHLALIQTAAFLPWGLWAIELVRIRKARALLILVPLLSLTIFAGHWPTLIHMSLIWFAYFLFRARPILPAVVIFALAVFLAVCITAPQWVQTVEMMRHVTRAKIGYATAGENSYFPAAVVLWILPMIMGSRTPGFYPQKWWGSWHLCEMLGYVGLVVLVIALATAWRLFRREQAGPLGAKNPNSDIVRTWTYLAGGAFIFMLGYYLPTYRLVHMLPGLGVVRCPARMILAVDFALVTLAALGVHTIIKGQVRSEKLAESIRRGAARKLPITVLAVLCILTLIAFLTRSIFPGGYPWPFNGGPGDVLASVHIFNPAVWVPLVMIVATACAVWFWLKQPGVRWPVLIIMLIMDLFMVARFVDVPQPGKSADPENSPAAAWLKANDPNLEKYRVWGMTDSYCYRPAELLLAKTNSLHDIASISTYGPFISPNLPHVLGFRIYGTNRDWRKLVRTNALLSLYDVKYLIAEADSDFAKEIEGVAPVSPLAGGASEIDNHNELKDSWELSHAEGLDGGVISLSTPFMWRWSQISQKVRVQPGGVYRISLDARAPEGGTANFLQADLIRFKAGGLYYKPGDCELIVYPEQIGQADWRHFEWISTLPEELAESVEPCGIPVTPAEPVEITFRVFTMSERPIEVKNISLCSSSIDTPILARPVKAGEAIYKKIALLPAVRAGDSPIAIYENLLVDTVSATDDPSAASEVVKYNPLAGQQGRPVVGVSTTMKYHPRKLLLLSTLPAICVYLMGLAILIRRDR